MLPFKFTKVEEGKRRNKTFYFVTDSLGREWSFEPVTYKGGETIYMFHKVPAEYREIRGTLNGIPFFKEVEEHLKKTLDKWNIKKHNPPSEFEDFINTIL